MRSLTFRRVLQGVAAVIALLFGVATVFAGGRVLMGADPGYVVFRPLLLYNTTMGFLYVAAGIAIWRHLKIGRNAASAIFGLNLLVLAFLLVVYGLGGVVAIDSLRAMTLRTSVWLALFGATAWLERSRPAGGAGVR